MIFKPIVFRIYELIIISISIIVVFIHVTNLLQVILNIKFSNIINIIVCIINQIELNFEELCHPYSNGQEISPALESLLQNFNISGDSGI